jgi:hypothetical protein
MDEKIRFTVKSNVINDTEIESIEIVVTLKDGVDPKKCSSIIVERAAAKWLADNFDGGWIEYCVRENRKNL